MGYKHMWAELASRGAESDAPPLAMRSKNDIDMTDVRSGTCLTPRTAPSPPYRTGSRDRLSTCAHPAVGRLIATYTDRQEHT
jgi:hypothetical protein